jgi:hypothetical protein
MCFVMHSNGHNIKNMKYLELVSEFKLTMVSVFLQTQKSIVGDKGSLEEMG